MKVLGILGSPRKGGNTDILLEQALAGARESNAVTEKIVLADLRYGPCLECEVKNRDGSCRVKDDMQLVYPKIAAADVFILASPIFFGSITAQTKAMIDRFQCRWLAVYMLHTLMPADRKKPGAFICAEASTHRDFFDNAKQIVRNFFATIDVEYTAELLCTGLEAKGDASNRPECLESALEIGRKLTEKA